MTATRQRLPNRRECHIESLEVDGQEFTAYIGFDPETGQSVYSSEYQEPSLGVLLGERLAEEGPDSGPGGRVLRRELRC